MEPNIKAIITGATGMVGEGVLHECLMHPQVEKVLVVNRRPCGVQHPKLEEVILSDFFNPGSVAGQLAGYNACFFCLGVSSLGMKKEEYHRVTYDLTMAFARTVLEKNPGMVFCYVSGAGTDSSEKGRISWARVKGKTENDLMKLPFRAVYAFRPAFMLPTKGLKNALGFYKYVNWMFPLFGRLAPGSFGTLKALGLAMIHAATVGFPEKVVTAKMINTSMNRKS
ncbi:MAG: hypothetical protein ACM3N9_05010 [Syntrophothermus sp.]